MAVLELFESILPEPRRYDLKVTMVLDLLMRHAFVSVASVAEALQCSEAEGELALRATLQSTFEGEPLIQAYKETWILGKKVGRFLAGNVGRDFSPLVPYLMKDRGKMKRVALDWRENFGAVTSGDMAEICRVAVGTAKSVLEELREEGTMVLVGQGRTTRYE